MRDSDRKSIGRRGPPPPVTTPPQGGPPPVGAASLWEPGAVEGALSLDDRQIEDLATDEAVGDQVTKDWESDAPADPVVASRPGGRTGPVARNNRGQNPPVLPVLPTETAVGVPRVAKRRRRFSSPPPPAPREVVIQITEMEPANPEELLWVTRCDGGIAVDVPREDGSGFERVEASLAYLVTDVQENTEGCRSVTGDFRWHGMPDDRERQWRKKLFFEDSLRLKQFMAALRYLLSFPDDLRVGTVVQFIGAPLTDPERIEALRFVFPDGKPGEPVPAVRVVVNTVVADAEYLTAQQCYAGISALWLFNFLKWDMHPVTQEWRVIFDSEVWHLYWLGRRITKRHFVPPIGQDGLPAELRDEILDAATQLAGPAIASFCKIAWSGRGSVEAAMHRLDMEPVQGTRCGDTMVEGNEDE